MFIDLCNLQGYFLWIVCTMKMEDRSFLILHDTFRNNLVICKINISMRNLPHRLKTHAIFKKIASLVLDGKMCYLVLNIWHVYAMACKNESLRDMSVRKSLYVTELCDSEHM